MKREVPPFWERFWRGNAYLLLLGAAIYAAFGELPKSLLFAADPFQLSLWTLLGSTGLFAAWAAWKGRYKLEYAVLPFLIGFNGVYIIALLAVVVTGENPGSGLALFFMCSFACAQLARWSSLNQLLDGPIKQLLDGPLKGLRRRKERDE